MGFFGRGSDEEFGFTWVSIKCFPTVVFQFFLTRYYKLAREFFSTFYSSSS